MADLHVEQKRTLRFRLILGLLLAVAAASAAWYFSVRSPAKKTSVVASQSPSAARPAPSSAPPAASANRPDDPLLSAPLPGLPSATSTEVTTTSGVRATREEKNAAMPSEDADESADGSAAATATASTTSGGPQTVSGAPPAASTTDALTDVTAIAGAADPAALDGRAVSLTGMKLQRQVGGLLAIGSDPENWVLVAPAIGRGPKIPTGATLAVSGRVQRLPAVAQAAKQWQISKASQKHLAGKQIYVQASLIEVKR